MLEGVEIFFKKWFNRLRTLSFLVAIWAVFFSVFTLTGLRIGFEYDDGLSFSTPAFQTAQKDGAEILSPRYWTAVNSNYRLEHTKPAVWLSAWFFKVLGFKIDIFCQRDPAGSDSLERNWKPLADNFHFVADEDQKYQLLEKNPFSAYFASSDAGIIQARKAGVAAVRIRKSKKSILSYEFNPRKFGEPVLPLSEF